MALTEQQLAAFGYIQRMRNQEAAIAENTPLEDFVHDKVSKAKKVKTDTRKPVRWLVENSGRIALGSGIMQFQRGQIIEDPSLAYDLKDVLDLVPLYE